MTRKPSGRPNGRPPKEFDQKTFEGLCVICCTWEEIEKILQGEKESISYWCKRVYGETFQTVYKRFSAGGKASLRRNQFRMSKHNPSMAIWLGKNWLAQRDDPTGLDGVSGELKEFIEYLKDKYRVEDDITVKEVKPISKHDANRLMKEQD